MSLGFTCRPIESEEIGGSCKVSLFRLGKELGISLNGTEIRDQLAFGEYTLIVTCHDYYDGEQTWFNLLSSDLDVVDVVSPLDQTGFVSLIDKGAYPLEFKIYQRDKVWRLYLWSKRRITFSLKAMFQRPFKYWFKKRLLVLS
ncbi:hypothetical protein ACUR5C_00315 [Aliikangiella sp. IMCC44653]